MDEKNLIANAFEESFTAVPLQRQIENCDHYELAPYFKKELAGHQPILEAGCGSGRWVGWFIRQGWQATGVDWSETLCAEARQQIQEGEFVASDIAAMPFDAESFGSIVALGSIEHSPEGPAMILKEFRRVLAKDGCAIITIPYLSPVRKIRRLVKALLGRRSERMVPAPAGYAGRWAADYHLEEGDWTFFQYVFNKKQMRSFLTAAGFVIEDEFVDFKDEGILHNFGRIVGTYDHNAGRVVFNGLGRILRALIPLPLIGHMLCYKVTKKS